MEGDTAWGWGLGQPTHIPMGLSGVFFFMLAPSVSGLKRGTLEAGGHHPFGLPDGGPWRPVPLGGQKSGGQVARTITQPAQPCHSTVPRVFPGHSGAVPLPRPHSSQNSGEVSEPPQPQLPASLRTVGTGPFSSQQPRQSRNLQG